MKRRALFGVLALFLVSGIAAGTASAVTVVVPNSLATSEGDGANAFPFHISSFFPPVPSMRYQQVLHSSEFGAFGGPAVITQIAFRPDGVFGNAFSSVLPSVRIDLSTTSAAPDALSPIFAGNVGADATPVFNGSLPLSSVYAGPAGGPKDFDIVVNLTTPFFYDPAAGNLLLDVRNFGGGSTTFLDIQNPLGDSTSRVFSTVSGSVNDPSGVETSAGLVTRFTGTPVPAFSCVGFETQAGNGRGIARNNRILQLKADLVDREGNIVLGTDIVSPPALRVTMAGAGGSAAIDVTEKALSAGRGTSAHQFVFTAEGVWQFSLMTKNFSTPGTYTASIRTGNIREYAINPTCTATFVIE